MCPAGEWFPLWVESAAVMQLMVKMPSDIASLPDSQTAFALRAMHGSGIGWRFECRQTVGAEYNTATKTGKRKPSDRKKQPLAERGRKKCFQTVQRFFNGCDRLTSVMHSMPGSPGRRCLYQRPKINTPDLFVYPCDDAIAFRHSLL